MFADDYKFLEFFKFFLGQSSDHLSQQVCFIKDRVGQFHLTSLDGAPFEQKVDTKTTYIFHHATPLPFFVATSHRVWSCHGDTYATTDIQTVKDLLTSFLKKKHSMFSSLAW